MLPDRRDGACPQQEEEDQEDAEVALDPDAGPDATRCIIYGSPRH
jgi:hypothetical protein